MLYKNLMMRVCKERLFENCWEQNYSYMSAEKGEKVIKYLKKDLPEEEHDIVHTLHSGIRKDSSWLVMTILHLVWRMFFVFQLRKRPGRHNLRRSTHTMEKKYSWLYQWCLSVNVHETEHTHSKLTHVYMHTHILYSTKVLIMSTLYITQHTNLLNVLIDLVK